ncbi:MAG TPA: rhodanese-like domain-containing protein, partial [Gemmatimonadales bacterium]|nr:rhodanese-like domain-containing protein [Gemmatimonadales bacterium]
TVTELIDYEAFCGVGAAPVYNGLEISATELAGELREQRPLLLLDVREPFEWEIGHLDNARLVPVGQLPARMNELDGHQEIVTYCHTGVRSMRALEILKAGGFSRVRSLRGGIDAWSREVDPSVTRY